MTLRILGCIETDKGDIIRLKAQFETMRESLAQSQSLNDYLQDVVNDLQNLVGQLANKLRSTRSSLGDPTYTNDAHSCHWRASSSRCSDPHRISFKRKYVIVRRSLQL